MSTQHTTYDSIDLMTTVTVEEDGHVTAVAKATRQKVEATKEGWLKREEDGSRVFWTIRLTPTGFLMHVDSSREAVLRQIMRSAASDAARFAVNADV